MKRETTMSAEKPVKIYNTSKYRKGKRVIAYISPSVKKKLIRSSKKNQRSVSMEVAHRLEQSFKG